jgi:hypothetical protein
MKHMFRWPALIFSTLILSVAARESGAQSVPYRAHGTGSYSPAHGDYGGVGVGIHLGKHTFLGKVATSPTTTDPLVFDFVLTDPQETVAANGDTLLFGGSGQVTLILLDATSMTFMAVWEGDFVVVGGTGRFAGARPADEPLRVLAINAPFSLFDPVWSFSWELTGRIVVR